MLGQDDDRDLGAFEGEYAANQAWFWARKAATFGSTPVSAT